MPRAQDARRMSAQEYLSFEESAQVRHEFVDGFVFAMAGASDNHNLICANVITQVRLAARGTKCRTYVNDMKFSVAVDTYYYPNILVDCSENERGKNIKTEACLIIEVLSESTGDIDRGEKLRNYRKAVGLQAYILVSQTQKLVETYRPLGDGSWRHEILEEGSIDLPCLDVGLSFDDIYEDVVLE